MARKPTNRPTPEDSEEVKTLRDKVRALERELETANFKALYYATLMRVAEDELGIDIEKKPPWPGPLPSPKARGIYQDAVRSSERHFRGRPLGL